MNQFIQKKSKLVDLLPKLRMTLDPKNHLMPHPIYQLKDIEKLNFTHRKPADFTDRLALTTVKNFRRLFDLLTGYNQDRYSGRLWLNRVIFLETIAGVPGMCGGMTIHLKSLRTLKPDRGFIHYLLEEAENERTHLFLFMNYKNPSYLFRAMIAMGQGVFWNFYFLWYLISPRFCHRFVGYLEEEAVHTYSIFLKQMDAGYLPEFNVQASKMARDYYSRNTFEIGNLKLIQIEIVAVKGVQFKRSWAHSIENSKLAGLYYWRYFLIASKERDNSILIKHLQNQQNIPSHQSEVISLPRCNKIVPPILSDDATFRDMVLSIRADESVHREFNHYFSDLKPDEEIENLQVYVTEENDEQVQNIKLDEEISKINYDLFVSCFVEQIQPDNQYTIIQNITYQEYFQFSKIRKLNLNRRQKNLFDG